MLFRSFMNLSMARIDSELITCLIAQASLSAIVYSIPKISPEYLPGQTHLDPEQDFSQIGLVPSCQQAFTGDASFAGLFLLQEVEGYMADDGEVLS